MNWFILVKFWLHFRLCLNVMIQKVKIVLANILDSRLPPLCISSVIVEIYAAGRKNRFWFYRNIGFIHLSIPREWIAEKC